MNKIRDYGITDYKNSKFPINIHKLIIKEFEFVGFDMDDELENYVTKVLTESFLLNNMNYVLYEYFYKNKTIKYISDNFIIGKSFSHREMINMAFDNIHDIMKKVILIDYNKFINFDTNYISYINLLDCKNKKWIDDMLIPKLINESNRLETIITIADIINAISYDFTTPNFIQKEPFEIYNNIIDGYILKNIKGLGCNSLIAIIWSINQFYINSGFINTYSSYITDRIPLPKSQKLNTKWEIAKSNIVPNNVRYLDLSLSEFQSRYNSL